MNPFIKESLQRELVLASRSPRRISLLNNLDINFQIEPADLSIGGMEFDCNAYELPVKLAVMKAEQVSERMPHSLVIGADTVVIMQGEALGKPADGNQAAGYLKKLGGRTHHVITGLAIRRESDGLQVQDKETTKVKFKELDEEEINAYVRSGEWKDKAGGYAIQGLGSCLVTGIEGCFFNVVGLPIAKLLAMLKSI